MPFLLVKSLHIVGVVLFLGNIITGVFWVMHASRKGELRAREQALDGIIASDRWFTMPGVTLIVITGVTLALLAGFPILGTRWILWSLVMFGISGAVFASRVAPLQKKLLANVRAGLVGTWDRGEYERLSRSWQIWGSISTLTPIAAVFLMVMKPG